MSIFLLFSIAFATAIHGEVFAAEVKTPRYAPPKGRLVAVLEVTKISGKLSIESNCLVIETLNNKSTVIIMGASELDLDQRRLLLSSSGAPAWSLLGSTHSFNATRVAEAFVQANGIPIPPSCPRAFVVLHSLSD